MDWFVGGTSPAPKEITYPVLLDFPAPKLKGYPKETAVAEKFHAMVDRGLLNSRMKDFYDVAFLADRFTFDTPTLARAIRETFSRRRTSVGEASVVFSAAFAQDAGKAVQWKAFLRKNKLKDAPPEFSMVMKRIRAFLEPIVKMNKEEA